MSQLCYELERFCDKSKSQVLCIENVYFKLLEAENLFLVIMTTALHRWQVITYPTPINYRLQRKITSQLSRRIPENRRGDNHTSHNGEHLLYAVQ